MSSQEYRDHCSTTVCVVRHAQPRDTTTGWTGRCRAGGLRQSAPELVIPPARVEHLVIPSPIMSDARETCWTIIQAAARGDVTQRERFARDYEPVIRAYLAARWRGQSNHRELDDAVQQVFVECYKEGGVLDRVSQAHPLGFRAFLFGVARNIARRFESGRPRPQALPADMCTADEDRWSVVFDRSWATTVMRQAAERLAERAAKVDDRAQRRVELLRLRFQEDLPIRDIAERWDLDPVHLHREYARARREFKEALSEVMEFHAPGPAADIEAECVRLLALLA